MKKYKYAALPAFDDILLVPQHSEITSRKNVSLSSNVGNINFNVPIIASPMDTVTEARMATEMSSLGAGAVLHRYMPIEMQAEMFKNSINNLAVISEDSISRIMTSIGATGSFLTDAKMLVGAGCRSILVDTANGHSSYAIEATKALKKEFGTDVHIMAGNVATAEGYARLADAGADSIRVGIGGGSACTTRIVSGHGIPTLASILDIRDEINYGDGPAIIADGGIRNSGDAAKALAAGANAVMLGNALAGTDESPGELINGNSKVFRGMASREAQADGRGYVSGVEGIATTVPYRGPAIGVINDFVAGISSAMSYTGVDNLHDFHYNSMYVEITSAAMSESRPHGKAH